MPEDDAGKPVHVAGRTIVKLYEQYTDENLQIVEGKLVFEREFEVSSDRISRMELFQDEIRIPFEEIAPSPYDWGTIHVSFVTDGRTFEAVDEYIPIKP